MNEEYEVTIGMEIHAELKTHSKMFCSSKNDADETRPNVNICPVCMAHPGTLPVINETAIRHVLKVGLALGSTLADYTEFDRKNYFYPDQPKGYQLSQFEYPLVSGGMLHGVELTRIHLEEDTASSVHDDVTGATLIDFNRAGVPLMELVTEPVMHSAAEASAFARELQLLLKYVGASDANMEKGEMRVEANVSVALKGTRSKGYVEIKNLNSFRTMERAVAYEIERQTKLVKEGGEILKETRGWDDARGATFIQRTKEGAADYRYFPDPDLPSLKLSELSQFDNAVLRAEMPELPSERRARYLALGIKSEDAEQYVREPVFGNFFDEVLLLIGADAARSTLASNYIANDLVSLLRTGDTGVSVAAISITAQHFAYIIEMLSDKKISSRSGKDLLKMCLTDSRDPHIIAEEQKMFQDDSKLAGVVASVIAENPSVVADIRAGKTAVIEFLVGQCMKVLRGAGDAATIRGLLMSEISK